MRIGLIYSRQPGNPYVGGSNENVQMYALAQGLAPLLRAGGHDVEIPANTDYDGSGSLTYADNTAWLRARNSVKKFDIVISCHSNAMGDACILYGQKNGSLPLAQKLQSALNSANFMYGGDKWEFNTRQVGEITALSCPSILLEWGRHDTAAYSSWLKTNISNGNLAKWGAAAILKAIGTGSGGVTPEPPVTPVTPPATEFPKTGNDFIDRVAPWAVESGQKYGIPPSVVIAQAILESAWGGSTLTRDANALYGVKHSTNWPKAGNPYVSGYVIKKTAEQTSTGAVYYVDARFCSYRTQKDSTLDHGLFLNQSRYLSAKNNYASTKNAKQYARDIRTAGYATDIKYPEKLISLMDKYNLYKFDGAKLPGTVEPPTTNNPDPNPDPDPEPEKGAIPLYVASSGSSLIIHLKGGGVLHAYPVQGGRWIVR